MLIYIIVLLVLKIKQKLYSLYMDITRLALVLAILVIVYLIVDRTRDSAETNETKPEQPQPIRVVYTTPSYFPNHPYLYGGPRWRRRRRHRF